MHKTNGVDDVDKELIAALECSNGQVLETDHPHQDHPASDPPRAIASRNWLGTVAATMMTAWRRLAAWARTPRGVAAIAVVKDLAHVFAKAAATLGGQSSAKWAWEKLWLVGTKLVELFK